MEQRAHTLARIAATLAMGQRVEHHMSQNEATRFVENAEMLLSTAEQMEHARVADTGAAHQQAMERFTHHAPDVSK